MASEASTPADQSRVAAVLTWQDMNIIKMMLADVPFREAEPIYQSLLQLAAHQELTGLRPLAQKVFDENAYALVLQR